MGLPRSERLPHRPEPRGGSQAQSSLAPRALGGRAKAPSCLPKSASASESAESSGASESAALRVRERFREVLGASESAERFRSHGLPSPRALPGDPLSAASLERGEARGAAKHRERGRSTRRGSARPARGRSTRRGREARGAAKHARGRSTRAAKHSDARPETPVGCGKHNSSGLKLASGRSMQRGKPVTRPRSTQRRGRCGEPGGRRRRRKDSSWGRG